MRILYKVLALLGAGGLEESGVFNKKSTESVLKEIYEAYPDAFADGRRLSGLFADFSGGQLRAQKNQLDIFLKCGGNTRILALRDEAPRKQQREYRRLVGEMTDSYGMQQECALEISSTFWKTALGTQAPAMGGQEKKEKPAKKPSEKQPGGQRIKGLLMLFGKMSGFARLMFAVGAYGVIACTVRLMQVMIRNGFGWWVFYLMDGIYLLYTAVLVFDMIPREPSRLEVKVLAFVLDDSNRIFIMIWFLFMVSGMICPFPFILEEIFLDEIETAATPGFAILGLLACWIYAIVWVIRLFKSSKKNSTMW